MVKAVNDIAAKYRLEVGTFGHAGDGNLHPTFLCDKRDADEFKRVEEAIDEMFDTAIKLKGTLSERARHWYGQVEVDGKGNLARNHSVLAAVASGSRPQGLLNSTKLVGI